jgi:hypothetical protein
MYPFRVCLRSFLVLLSAFCFDVVPAAGQWPPIPAQSSQQQPPATGGHGADHQHEQPPQPADHSHHAGTSGDLFPQREGSGTSWLPERTPMYGVLRQVGPWSLMGHGQVFAQYLHDAGDRGSDQAGSINWLMGMARREVAGARVGVRAMISLEPWTIGGCGYPDLLATGELCRGRTIHDRQHQHDLFMELAAEYDRPLHGAVRWQVYAGLAGEPALGPVAYPHRLSAMSNPLAPIAHHWLDATHITFGVVTAGIHGSRWKAEGSAFNGREPDEDRTDLDLGRLDSFSGRVTFLPAATLALQVSAGHLNDSEEAHDAGTRVDVDRITASATYHRPLDNDGLWAATVAWGRNREAGDSADALLFETSLWLRERDIVFGRFEVARKAAHDLDIENSHETFPVTKLQAGYVRYIRPWHRLQPGVGGGLSLSFVPQALEPYYGGRATPGLAVFMTIRPAAHRM